MARSITDKSFSLIRSKINAIIQQYLPCIWLQDALLLEHKHHQMHQPGIPLDQLQMCQENQLKHQQGTPTVHATTHVPSPMESPT